MAIALERRTYAATGEVLERTSGSRVAHARVEAWDRDGRCPDVVAYDITDEAGAFRIAIDGASVRQLFGNGHVTLFFKVFIDGRMLASTENSVVWPLASTPGHVRLNIDEDAQLDGRASPLVVRGQTIEVDGTPVAGQTVRAFHKGLRQEVPLGATVADAAGRYRIEYDLDTLARARGGGTGIVRLLVRAFDADGKQTAESALICPAPATAAVDLVIGGGDYRGPSDYKLAWARAPREIDGVPLADLSAEDIALLTCGDERDGGQLEALARATRLARDLELPAEAAYALVRAGLPVERRALLSVSPHDVRRVLERGLSDNVIPAQADDFVETIIAKLRTASVQLAFEPARPGEPTVGDLLATVLPEREAQRVFMTAYVQHDGPIDEFWRGIASADQFGAVVDSLQFALQMGALTGNHPPLVRALQDMRAGGQVSTPRDLAKLDEDDWVELLARSEIGTPASAPGADAAARRRAYAKRLVETIETAFPTAALADRLQRDETLKSDHLARFFGNMPEFEFGAHRVGPYLRANPAALDGVSDREAATAQLKGIERIFKVTRKPAQIKALMADGIHSAQMMVRMGEGAFIKRYADLLGGVDIAAALHCKAVQTYMHAIALFLKYHPAANATDAWVLPNIAVIDDALTADPHVAEWRELFGAGSVEFCACEHCQSVYGPAAYLVDLLQFLDRYDSTETTQAKSKWNLFTQKPTAAKAIVKSAKDVLLTRRPDIGRLELSCENTNTLIPYVDLVNEVLEHAVVKLAQPSLAYPEHIAVTGTSDELAATPEPIEPAVHAVAIATLSAAVYPWNLPFDLSVEEARIYLKHLGAPRNALMHAFHVDAAKAETPPSAADMAELVAIGVEHLELTGLPFELITDPSPQEPWLNWGLGPANWATTLQSVPKILSAARLDFDELKQLLLTAYVRRLAADPSNPPWVKYPDGATGCGIEGAQIAGLAAPLETAWNELHRFLRLRQHLGWSLWDLDKAVTALGSPDVDDLFLLRLSQVSSLRSDLRVPLTELLSWYAPVDTWSGGTPETRSLYEQLFLNKAVTNPVDEAFRQALDPDVAPAEVLSDHSDAVLAALRITSTDLSLLIDTDVSQQILNVTSAIPPNSKLTVANLSTLFRHASLARTLRLGVGDVLALKALTGRDPFDAADLRRTTRFVESAKKIRTARLSVAELDYVLRHVARAPTGVAPAEATIDSLLDEIESGLAKVIAETTAGPDPTGELTATKLRTLLPADAVAPALGVIAGTSNATEADQNALIDAAFDFLPDTSGLKTNLVGSTALGRKEDRFAYVLERLLDYLRFQAGESLVEQKLGHACKLEAAASAGLLTTWLTSPSDPGSPAITDFDPPDNQSHAEYLAKPDAERQAEDAARRARQRKTFLRLEKAATVVTRLRIRTAELEWLFSTGKNRGLLDLNALPLEPQPGAADLFKAWERLADLITLRNRLPAGRDALLELLALADDPTASTDTYLAALADRAGWAPDDLAYLAGTNGLALAFPTDFQDERGLTRLRTCFELLRRLGMSAATVAPWTTPDLAPADAAATAAAIRAAVKAKYAEADWPDVAKPLRDPLREQQRAALVDYLVHQRHYATSDELFAEFLVDVEMSPCQLTSRVKQAIGSVQTFVQRCFLALEPTVHLPDDAARQWQWMKNYRVWEANRKVFLYPENWIWPELRDDRTPFFKALESELLQNDITNETAEDAFRHYLEKLDQVARLEIIALHHDTQTGVVHVVGRTPGASPHAYFYRRRDARAHWTPWEKIDLDIPGDHLLAIVHQRRLRLLWPIMTQKTDENPDLPPADQPGSAPSKYLQIQLAWSERRGTHWQAPRVANAPPLECYVVSLDDTSPLWFEVQPDGDDLVVRCWLTGLMGDPSDDSTLALEVGEFRLPSDGSAVSSGLAAGSKEEVPVDLWSPMRKPSAPGIGPYYTRFKEWGTTPLVLPRSGTSTSDTWWTLPVGVPEEEVFGNATAFSLLYPLPADVLVFDDRDRTLLVTPKRQTSNVWSFGPTVDPSLATQSPRTRYRFELLSHPLVRTFVAAFNDDGVDGLLAWAPQNPLQLDSSTFFEGYAPVAASVAQPYPLADVDFSHRGAHSIYNWELFFHAPLLIAERLSQNQRFEEAQRWFHYLFDPTTGSKAPSPKRYWKVRPFYENTSLQPIQELMENLADPNTAALQVFSELLFTGSNGDEPATDDLSTQIAAWRDNPFNPHLIARMRPVAYQKNVVMKYLDNLIALGDHRFSVNTLESINEATQAYILAASILGPRPRELPPRGHVPPMTYDELEPKLDDFSNALVQVENLTPAAKDGVLCGESTGAPTPELLYFCIPQNDELLAYWDTVSDRLFKIRHCMNIEGELQQLPLFEPSIDPAILVRAAAAGVDISSALSDLQAPHPAHRFSVLAQKASEMCAEVRALGASLLAALEKRDAEGLALLRSGQEVQLLTAIRDVKQKQVGEARSHLEELRKALDLARIKYDYYNNRPFLNTGETLHLVLSSAAAITQGVGEGIMAAAPPLHQQPTMVAGSAGSMGSPVATATTVSGTQTAHSAEAAGRVVTLVAGQLKEAGQLNATLGGYSRRADDWKNLADQALKEQEQIQKQIETARIRIEIADGELVNHDTQTEHAQALDEFLREKFTQQDLYDWSVSQVAAVHFQSYKLAYNVAKRAERALQFELGAPEKSFITFGYWDSLKQGLLAGEKLSYDLQRMEVARLEAPPEFEITKNVSLALLDPTALMMLKQTGACIVDLPETVFDADHRGHTFRRIKSLSITIPCTTAAHTSVNCKLTLLRNSIRVKSTDPENYPRKTQNGQSTDDERFLDDPAPIQSIITSTGINDFGLFELNFHDARYLPFEGAGAISQWRIELPQDTNAWDLGTISDVVMQIRYTARDGGQLLAQGATDALASPRIGARLFSGRHDFATDWHRFLHPTVDEDDQRLVLELDAARFPFEARRPSLTVAPAAIFVTFKGVQHGSDLVLHLNPPDGTPGADGPAGVVAEKQGVKYSSFAVSGQEPGVWTLTIKEADMAAAQTSEGMEAAFLDDGTHVRLNPDALDDIALVVTYSFDPPTQS
jgi:hypothetical protein